MSDRAYCATCGESIYWRGWPVDDPWVHSQWAGVDYDHEAQPEVRFVTVEIPTFLTDSDLRVALHGLRQLAGTVAVTDSKPVRERCKHGIPRDGRFCRRCDPWPDCREKGCRNTAKRMFPDGSATCWSHDPTMASRA
jgi:hypothetical protein